MIRELCVSLVIAAATVAGASTTSSLKLVDKLLPETVSRERASTATVDTVMLHFCSDVIANPDNPFQLSRITDIFTSVGVSAHYLIDRDGTVYRWVDESRMAFHAGRGIIPWAPERTNRLNEFSIGIEMFNVGTAEDMKIFMSPQKYREFAAKHPEFIGFTDAQYNALNALLADIRSRHPEIKLDRKHIFGHSEYAGRARRTDPGETFKWERIGLPAKSELEGATTAPLARRR